MTSPCIGTCSPWATVDDLCSPCYESEYTFDEARLEDYLQIASDLLYELSAQQFPGSCREIIYPCARRPGPTFPPAWPQTPINIPGYNPITMGCGCNDPSACGCSSLSEIHLPFYPITAINSVTVDGISLDSSLYRIDDFSHLVRLNDPDGTNPGWPCCQDLADPSFVVDFAYGRTPPTMGVKAAAVLACELYMACDPEAFGGSTCRLPRNISQIARQGVTVLYAALQPLIPHRGRPLYFNIPEVDLFLATYNSHGLTSRSVVLSPDLPPTGKRAGT